MARSITTFSGDGRAFADFAGMDDVATSMTVQADGKILVAGYTEVGPSSEDMAIVRFGLDGTLDTTFDGDGRFTRSRTSSNERIFDLVARGQSLIAVGGWGDDIDVFRYVLPNVAVTAQRNLLVFDHEHLTVTISRASFTEGETVAKATMTITRHNSDIDEALTVQPLSLDTSEIILPANAVIAAGERSVTIEITVVDDLYVDGTKAFQIGAVATDYEGQGIDVTVADNDAGPLGTGNILVTSYEVNGGPSQIREYTVTGTLVRIFEIPETADGDLRDLAVDADGNVQVWEGVFSPLLKTLNPATTVVNANALLPGWSTFNNVSYGGVSTFNNYVFVTDMQTAGGAATGLIRFDRNTGTSVRFAELANGFPLEFVDVAVGLDGLLYGLDSNDDVRVFDPVTLAQLRKVDITQTVFPDHRTLAVNAAGEIFVGAWDGRIRKFDGTTGALLATSTVTFGSLVDVEVRGDGTIIAGNWNDEFLVTNESLTTVTRFTLPNVSGAGIFVSFAAPAPIFNLRPAADDGSETVAEDGALNGTVTGSDPEGSLLTFAVEFGPSNGTLVLNANGTYTYTPDANFHGTDTFTFRASDGDLVE